MTYLTKLGGWWRLWVVFSVCWTLGVSLSLPWGPPETSLARTWITAPTIAEINSVLRSDCLVEKGAFLYSPIEDVSGLAMPTLAIKWPAGSVTQISCYPRFGQRDRWLENLSIILAVPLFLIIFGLTFRWVWSGFKPKT